MVVTSISRQKGFTAEELSAVTSLRNHEPRCPKSCDVVLRPVVAALGERLQHPDDAQRPLLCHEGLPIPGRVEEDHANVGLATNFVVQPQLIYAEPGQGFNALVSMIE